MARKRRNKNLNIWQFMLTIIVLVCILIYGYTSQDSEHAKLEDENNLNIQNVIFDLSTIPEYSGSPYVEINNNIPYFTEDDYTIEPFEKYSDLDNLGRSKVAYANICKEIMPSKDSERGEIGGIKPSGWVQKRFN